MEPSLDETFMLQAIEEAKKGKSKGDLPFGAIVVHNGEVVGRGRAENGTIGDVTDHAELMALREACRTLKRNNLNDCTIYGTNEPCSMCAAGIFQAKIADVRFGLSRSDLSFLRPRKLSINDLAEDSGYEIKITRGLLKDNVLELFKDIKKH
jgi:tRNA(Arg) A34 adenosine deaminase TadA